MTTVFTRLEPLLKSQDSRGLVQFMQEFEQDLAAFAKDQKGFLAQLTEYIFSGSGKRVRPGLVYVSSQFGKADPRAVKETALAVEMIHISTLVHDDLVDDAAMRRQKPTVGVKFGHGAAVLLGDHVYARAFQRLASLNDPELIRVLADSTMAMCEGEIDQLENRYVFDLTEEAYLSFLDRKTAALMAACCEAGGRLGGLPERQVRALESFGRHVGIAFQIVDDILDLEGEEVQTGKTLHTDLMHGKMTLPLIHALREIKDESEKAFVVEMMRNPEGHVVDLIKRVRDSGSIDYSRSKVLLLLEQADQALANLPDHPSRRLLNDISRRLADRQH